MLKKQQPLQELPFLRFDSFNSDDNRSSPCNCSSAKRPYPEPTANRSSKKPNRNSDSPGNFLGLSLSPISTTTTQSFPSLHRCVSDPRTPPMSPPGGFSVISLTPIPTQSLCSVPDPYTPPRSPNSHQFHSLAPQSNRISAFPPAVPTPSSGNTFSRSSSSNKIVTEESPNSQRWQRMKDRLKEMNEWLDEMREGEELKVAENEDPVKEDDVFVPNGEEGEEEEGGGIDEALISDCNSVNHARAIAVGLKALKLLGVEGVEMPVWWGIVEKEANSGIESKLRKQPNPKYPVIWGN